MRQFAAAVLLWVLPLPLVAADWPQFLGPNRSGASAETGLLRTWPPDGPAKVWERAVGSGWSGVTVAGNQLILFHRVGDDEVVECLAASSGKPLWKYATPSGYVDDFSFDDGPRATPAIAGERVYTLGAEGHLLCLNLKNGAKIWEKKLSVDYPFRKGYFGIGTSPVVVAGRVFVNIGSKGAGVVALDAATGRELWKATEHKGGYSTPTLATLAGQPHLVFLTRDGVLVLDPATGAVVHERPFRARIDASVNAATPLVVGQQLFFSSSYNTGALVLEAAKEGWKEVWKNDTSLSCHYNTPVHTGTHLFGLHGRQEYGADLRCVEWSTGKVAWAKKGFGCAGLILADGLLIAMIDSGELVLLEANPQKFRELARVQALGDKVRAAPALAAGRLFVRDTKKLVAFAVK